MSIRKFHNYANRPPKGGWWVRIGDKRFEAGSEGALIEDIAKWRRNNATFTSKLDIEREVWTQLCQREPERCKRPGDPKPMPANRAVVPRELTKDFQGPICWRFLNMAAVRWVGSGGYPEFFRDLTRRFLEIMECPKCKAHWSELLAENPPEKITSRVDACLWTNSMHNRVNIDAGHPQYPYERMIVEYGAPLLTA